MVPLTKKWRTLSDKPTFEVGEIVNFSPLLEVVSESAATIGTHLRNQRTGNLIEFRRVSMTHVPGSSKVWWLYSIKGPAFIPAYSDLKDGLAVVLDPNPFVNSKEDFSDGFGYQSANGIVLLFGEQAILVGKNRINLVSNR